MVFEAHGMIFPCTELLLFNYAKVKTVFDYMAHLSANSMGCFWGLDLLLITIKCIIFIIFNYLNFRVFLTQLNRTQVHLYM